MLSNWYSSLLRPVFLIVSQSTFLKSNLSILSPYLKFFSCSPWPTKRILNFLSWHIPIWFLLTFSASFPTALSSPFCIPTTLNCLWLLELNMIQSFAFGIFPCLGISFSPGLLVNPIYLSQLNASCIFVIRTFKIFFDISLE